MRILLLTSSRLIMDAYRLWPKGQDRQNPVRVRFTNHSDRYSFPGGVIRGSALPCGYYLNEVILRLVQKDQPHPTLFAHYALALAQLSENPEALEATLRSFELQLLEALGLLPDIANCRNDGEPISDDEQFLFYPSSNQCVLVPGDEAQHIAIPKQKTPQAVYHSDGVTVDVGVPVSGRTLNRLAAFDIDDKKVLSEIKPLMRRLLQMHLGDKPLNSRELFTSLTPPPPPQKQTGVSLENTASRANAVSPESTIAAKADATDKD